MALYERDSSIRLGGSLVVLDGLLECEPVLEVEEIERSIRETRAVEDINELDDTSVNPLLRNAGSDERGAFERVQLKHELNEEFGLSMDDFEFAEEYFEMPAGEREFIYTNAVDHDRGSRPGVFGLAHLWFDDEDDAPLGRVRRAFYYKPFGDGVKEWPVRTLQLTPDVMGDPITDETRTERGLLIGVRSRKSLLVDSRRCVIAKSRGRTCRVASTRRNRRR